jgi:tetratricopeptide (TPR) repeat protein
LIVGDFQQPGDIAAARRLDVSGDLVQRKHHVLDQACTSLGLARQKLLSRIACFRSPVSYNALKALAETESPDSDALALKNGVKRAAEASLDFDLRDLITRGLLHRDPDSNRFDLHPIVRRYAYHRLAVPDRVGAHALLRDYFAAVPKPEKVHSLDDLAPVIELYHHTVRAGQYDEACDLFYERLSDPTFYQLGAYQLRIELLRELFPDGEEGIPRLSNEGDQAWTLTALALSYSQSGEPRRAVPLFKRKNAISEKISDQKNVAVGLANLADEQIDVGALQAAEVNLRRTIALGREIRKGFHEAIGHLELGRLLGYRGAWDESDLELDIAGKMFEEQGNVQLQGVVWSFRAEREVGRLRWATLTSDVASGVEDLRSALAPARRALEIADQTVGTGRTYERDYIADHWLLGAAHLIAGELVEAESHLHESLERCRRNNTVAAESGILIDLARLCMARATPGGAQRLAEEALVIADRCGYVLQGADAHIVLAQLAKDRGDANELRHHATEALRLATCDGPPDYTYKAAYDEATALLR